MRTIEETRLRHARLAVGDVSLDVVEAGPPDGPPVVLLHGFPDFWWGWRHQIAALADAGFRVVAPDQRGYAHSDKPPGIDAYRLTHLVGDVVGLADALGLRRFALAGHDWGGVVAFATAARHPERVERLAVVNAPHPDTWAPYALRHPGQIVKSLYVGLFQVPGLPEALLRANRFGAMRRALEGSSRPGTFSAADLDRYVAAWSTPGALTAMLNWYRALRRPAPGPLPRIEAETLIIWGVADRFLERGLAAAAARRCRSARVIDRDAGHWVLVEEPEAVSAALIEIFAARPRPA